MANNANRFTETVENYVKYRPAYPSEIYAFLVQHCGLTQEKMIADVGSATGFLSQLFLEQGHTVYGVEPNQAMRVAGENYLARHPRFHSINGFAEATTLEDASVDWVVAGTAFHWFDAVKAKMEFKRILRSPGFALLIWNVRDEEHSAFLRDYETLISTYCKDYQHSPAQSFHEVATVEFFKPYHMKTAAFRNQQQFDWEGLKGRLLSTSYSLREADSEYSHMLHDLRKIFERHQRNGLVEFLYSCRLYYGQIK